MNNEKQRQAINEQELFDDVASVQEFRKNDLKEMNDKSKPKTFIFGLLCLLYSVAGIILFVVLMGFAGSWVEFLWVDYVLLATSLASLFVSFLLFAFRKKRRLNVFREDLCPEFVPDKSVVLSGDEPLAQSNAPVIRKIVNDPKKRKIKIDNRKVSRYINPDLTLEKMKEALRLSFASKGYELSESLLTGVLSCLGHGRVIFVRGLAEEEAKAFSEALSLAYGWKDEFVSSPSTSFDELRRSVSLVPAENSSTVVSLFGLGASKVEAYLSGYADALADCSLAHSVGEDFKVSVNLVVLVFMPADDESKGIPSNLLRYSTVFDPKLIKIEASSEPFEAVKTSADEIRYLASKKVHDFFLDDHFSASFDVFSKFEESKGSAIPNDFENALERFEAVELNLGLSQEEVAQDVLLRNLLPYYFAKYSIEDLSVQEGLLDSVKREFAFPSVEEKIASMLVSYKEVPSEDK